MLLTAPCPPPSALCSLCVSPRARVCVYVSFSVSRTEGRTPSDRTAGWAHPGCGSLRTPPPPALPGDGADIAAAVSSCVSARNTCVYHCVYHCVCERARMCVFDVWVELFNNNDSLSEKWPFTQPALLPHANAPSQPRALSVSHSLHSNRTLLD